VAPPGGPAPATAAADDKGQSTLVPASADSATPVPTAFRVLVGGADPLAPPLLAFTAVLSQLGVVGSLQATLAIESQNVAADIAAAASNGGGSSAGESGADGWSAHPPLHVSSHKSFRSHPDRHPLEKRASARGDAIPILPPRQPADHSASRRRRVVHEQLSACLDEAKRLLPTLLTCPLDGDALLLSEPVDPGPPAGPEKAAEIAAAVAAQLIHEGSRLSMHVEMNVVRRCVYTRSELNTRATPHCPPLRRTVPLRALRSLLMLSQAAAPCCIARRC